MVDECPDSDLTYTESKRPHGVYVYGLLLMIQNRALRDTSSSQLPLPPTHRYPSDINKKNVIVAGVAWLTWQWWENLEGICEVEFSLFSLSLLIDLLYIFHVLTP